MPAELDVLIVGAGLSGIAAAVHLNERCPGKRWLILESRDNLGGTWDLFRYPGVRGPSREPVRFECRFLLLCRGSYDYAQAYTRFAGRACTPSPLQGIKKQPRSR